MTAKSRDKHGRWRAKTIAFRASYEEAQAIDEVVSLSGLTKQEYIITRLQNRDVVVVGNPKVFKALRERMDNIYSELLRLNSAGEVSEQLLETINLVSKIYAGLNEAKGDRK